MKKLSVKEVEHKCVSTVEDTSRCFYCKEELPSKTRGGSQGNDYVEKKYAIKGDKLNSGSVKEVEGWAETSDSICDSMIERLGLEPDGHKTWATTTDEIVIELKEVLAEELPKLLAQAREERDKEIHEVILDILFSLDRDQSREYQRGVKVATSTIEMIVNKDLLASAERE